VAGEAVLTQTVAGTTWLIPHNGFFQTNEPLAVVLLGLVRTEAKATKADRVLDLYCGAGFFGLALAADAKEVVGIEENPQSVEAAGASALHSGIANARFLVGDLGAVLANLPRVAGEIAVVDPPREGLLPRALEALIARSPKRIVYVSCYPQSLVRDFKALAAAGWRGVSCTPVDMFPHTSHLEVVVTLER
jgi:23S rRNA (uracil1939-C5)-methyltransferase